MKREILSIGVVALGIMIAVGVLMVSGNGALAAKGFGFENNIQHRKSADAESVLGCMASCEEMLAGWLEMNPDSKNYTRQHGKLRDGPALNAAIRELADLDRVRLVQDGKRLTIQVNPALVAMTS